MPLTVAIDGPAGAGKSTVARRVASALGFTYLDTGAMYRALAWKARQQGVDIGDADALARLALAYRLTFSPLLPDGRQQVCVDEEEITDAIRTPEISEATSAISALPAVRRVIVEQQRQLGRDAERGVVLEGRDIGTVVFPHAEVKIFLTASPEERARRRHEELIGRGLKLTYAEVLADQQVRDARDSQRTDSPLVPAADAITLHSDALAVEEVVAHILALCEQKHE